MVTGADSIAILMGCRDGARFLPEQLASIAAQSHRNWRLVASDDGSSDATAASSRPSATRRARSGSRSATGRAAALPPTTCASPAIRGSVPTSTPSPTRTTLWHPDRLARGLAALRAVPPEVPALYGARTILIDEAGRETGRSRHFRAAPGFANALVQSIAGGNTMLFNPAAKALMEAARPAAVIAHDWWIIFWSAGRGAG